MKEGVFVNTSQEVVNAIKSKLKEKNATAAEMLASCDISKNAIQSMQAGYFPRIENLCKICDYLGCSVDYVLGRETSNTAEHLELMRLFDTLDDDSKEIIARLIVKLAKDR